jgi:hypothetical protein
MHETNIRALLTDSIPRRANPAIPTSRVCHLYRGFLPPPRDTYAGIESHV